MDFSGKNIILTGASGGIGLELLKLLSQYDNTRIVATARNIGEIPSSDGKVFPFYADVSKQEDIDRLFDYAKDTLGDVDLFIANAGFSYIEELKKPEWEHINAIYTVNTTSVIYSLLKFNQQAQGKPKQFACTISAVAFVPLHAYALYCSSKAALHQFIETYRLEQGDELVISAIYPIATKTSFFDHASGKKNTPPPYPTQSVEKVAQKIISGIKRNKRKIYPSTLFRWVYPIGRAFPIFLKLYSQMEKRKTTKWLRD